MSEEVRDFAKLYKVDGIGQILVTLDTDEKGDPSLNFSMMPEGFGVCCVKMAFKDTDKGWGEAEKAFDETTEEFAVKVVQTGIINALLMKAGSER